MLLKLCLKSYYFCKTKLYPIYFFTDLTNIANTIELSPKIPATLTTIHTIFFLIFLFQLTKSSF